MLVRAQQLDALLALEEGEREEASQVHAQVHASTHHYAAMSTRNNQQACTQG